MLFTISERKPEGAFENFCSITVSNRTCELIENILKNLSELEEISEAKDVFSESLLDIQKNVLMRKDEKPEFQRYTIIRDSLALLQSYLQMDYAGIWMIKGDETITLHESGKLHPSSNLAALRRQFDEAIEYTNNGDLAYLCPSDSEDGGVDAVLVFRNSKNEPIGFLLLDDHHTENEIPDNKMGEVIKIFYDRLKAIIYEEEVILARQEVLTIKKQLESMETELITTQHDKLTGLLRKEYGELLFQKSFERTKRNKLHGCICVLDVDNFKSVNDKLGHLIGDMVLQKIGDLLKNGNISSEFSYFPRKVDTVCRWGGEEFVLFLEETDANGGRVLAERIREVIQSFVFESGAGHDFKVTVTIGVSEIKPSSFHGQHVNLNTFFQRADDAMYAGKIGGRNQVVLYKEGMAKSKIVK